MRFASMIISLVLLFHPLSLLGQVKIEVPLSRQATDYTCGIASLQSVLGYYGENIRQDDLAKECKSKRSSGTKYENIIKCAESYGLIMLSETGMTVDQLKSLIDDSKPVILAIQAWREDPDSSWAEDWEDGHYVVAVGYDASNIYFMDPSTFGNYTYIPLDEFLTRWHDKSKKNVLDHFGMYSTNGIPSYDPKEIKKLD
jgi:ABC-type bacteriocin/lantibiotic exporter with double-glycine peptidase domain